MTRNHRQEALSRAYVRAVAGQAGLLFVEVEADYGVDVCLRQVTPRGGRVRDVGPQIDLQLKSTTRADVGLTHLTYDLAAVNYEDLRTPGLQVPRFLVVLVLPEDEADWVSQSPDALILRHCAYWWSLRGQPTTTASRSVRLSIPLTNIFSAAAVRGLFAEMTGGKAS
jgi:hypothetical protein